MSDREQKLVDIAFDLVATAFDREHAGYMHKLSNEQRMAWVADQLRKCGFDTRPVGASWGVLVVPEVVHLIRELPDGRGYDNWCGRDFGVGEYAALVAAGATCPECLRLHSIAEIPF